MRPPPFVLAGSLTLLCAAAAAAPSFRFEREVLPASRGGNRLLPDAALLAGAATLRYRAATLQESGAFSGGLEDLRLFDRSGREVAYLLIPPASKQRRWQRGRILPIAATKTASGFEVALPASVAADRLSLGGIPSPFLKRVRLEGSGDRSRWTLLVPEGTLFDLPDDGLRSLALDFSPGEFRYYRVTWDDRTSGRVPLPREVTARLAGSPEFPPPVRVPLKMTRRESEPGRSRFTLRLPGPRLPVEALEFEVASGNLLRRIEVAEPRLSGGEVLPVPLGSGTLRRAERGGLSAEDLAVEIRSPEGQDLDIVVEDGNNASFSPAAVFARFAPLPAIYFESADGESLTARYGSPSLSAPRYDLEASRDLVSEWGAFPQARWGEQRVLASDADRAASPLPATGAPVDAGKFRHARKVPPGPPGLTALLLDDSVLAGTSDLSDVRIADSAGRQVPYLLEKRDEPLALELPSLEALSEAPRRAGLSRYRLVLPRENLPPARLVLSTSARVFDRRVELSAPRPESEEIASEAGEQILASAAWRHADPESPAPDLVLSLPRVSVSRLGLTVDEGDNRPLSIGPPRLLLPAYRLRFFRGEGSETLTLLYGQAGLSSPRYDLSLLAPRLVGASAHELSLAPETTAASSAADRSRFRGVFWAVLVVVVLLLLALIVRLFRRERPAP